MRATTARVLMCTMVVGAFAAPALAQDAPALVQEDLRPAIDANQTPLSAEETATLGNALLFDPATLTASAPAKPLRLPSLLSPPSLDVNHTDKPDGSTTIVVKKPLATDWDTNVGADLGLGAQQPTDGYRPGQPLPGSRDAGGSGAAWASVGVPNFASVDARVDPSKDQSKLGTTFKQSIPVGSQFAVTLQNTYSVTETLGAQTPGPSDLPLMALPAPGAPPTLQIWGSEKLAKFDVLSTGTTLAAGLNSTSIDPVTHNKLSADQKLYGPLHVTTAVSDLGQPVPNKSITAGFKLNW